MASAKSPPTLVFIVGPPAVGKMTVGYELAQRTGLKLFHNHHTIDLALRSSRTELLHFIGSLVSFGGGFSKRSPPVTFQD
jgi:adenylate kinase family enzyme